jgi:hypothetical protein
MSRIDQIGSTREPAPSAVRWGDVPNRWGELTGEISCSLTSLLLLLPPAFAFDGGFASSGVGVAGASTVDAMPSLTVPCAGREGGEAALVVCSDDDGVAVEEGEAVVGEDFFARGGEKWRFAGRLDMCWQCGGVCCVGWKGSGSYGLAGGKNSMSDVSSVRTKWRVSDDCYLHAHVRYIWVGFVLITGVATTTTRDRPKSTKFGAAVDRQPNPLNEINQVIP